MSLGLRAGTATILERHSVAGERGRGYARCVSRKRAEISGGPARRTTASANSRAANTYREALAWTHRAKQEAGLEVFIRINVATLHLEAEHFLEAEEEIRRAERLAISERLVRRLVPIYTLFGRLRGAQGDESGFVFFEQAIQLARLLEGGSAEAQTDHEYGRFKLLLGEPETARGYLERARELFESVGSSAELESVKAELRRVSE